jgi:Fe-S cluster assembly scaffold protein SufB
MNYLWEEFNIKTFPAETIVFRDGVYQPELSTLPNNSKIENGHDLPIHIIYVGEISGKKDINFEMSAPNQQVFFTSKVTNKNPAFLSIFIKNTGKNSDFRGKLLIQNFSAISVKQTAQHFAKNTGIFLENKIVAHSGTETKLFGVTKIEPGCDMCGSNISFAALAAPDAKIQFSPDQRISGAPEAAGHSAFIWRATPPQIQYLGSAGLSADEIKKVLEEAFTNDSF